MGAIQSKKKKNKKSVPDGDVDFDHFQVLRAIGRGSFSKVCIVQKRDSKLMYAMKYMGKRHCVKLGSLRNVLQEVEILTSIDHPFLINLWFTFQDEEDLFLITDLLLGGDLRYHILRGVKFTEESIKMFIYELALALEYLQSKRIIHRDIKPDNIVLDDAGHAHLTDFNIAMVLKRNQLATALSGTKPYIAPEMYDCAVGVCTGYSFSVDWWSLGIVGYELLLHSTPYNIRSATTLQDARALFHNDVVYPASFSPNVKQMFSELLDRNAGTRITTLGELQQLRCYQPVDMDRMMRKEYKPAFGPATNYLNCDASLELEEMIVEKNPLHKKKKRLAKQRLRRTAQSTPNLSGQSPMELRWGYIRDFRIYNRYQELERRERERKELLWEQELQQAMNASGSESQEENPETAAAAAPGCSEEQLDVPGCSGLKTSPTASVLKRIVNTPRVKKSGKLVADPHPNYSRVETPTIPPLEDERQHPRVDEVKVLRCKKGISFATVDDDQLDYIDDTPSPLE